MTTPQHRVPPSPPPLEAASTQQVPAGAPALEMRGVSKSFPGVRALSDVSFTAYAGEVHALMGENGAGKSTLMKILAGAYSADAGEIVVDGKVVRISGPIEARRVGISLIYQELNLAHNLTVAENIHMGSEPAKGILVDRATMRRNSKEILNSLGARFSPDALVSSLSIAEGQLVEIARALHFKPRVLVMDEPTAALSERETERLFEIVQRLRADGIAIIYISHRMAEVYKLADRVTVLRDGEYIGTLDRQEISAERVVQMMVGRQLQDFYEHARSETRGAPVLEVRDLTDGAKIAGASLTVHAGEILGLAGLVGAGRTELARLIFGADPAKGGSILLNGQPLTIRSPVDAINAGIGYVPENRKEQGLFLELSARENIAMNTLHKSASSGVLNDKRIVKVARDAVQNFRIRVANLASKAIGLSGGNQQKLLVARWVAINPKVMILDEPTRGVDIGAKAEIYRIMGEVAQRGVAIIMISSELPEIVGMSDRVLVMREGKIVGELEPRKHNATMQDQITQENIMRYATGIAEEVAHA